MSDANLSNLYFVRESSFADESVTRASNTLTVSGAITADQTVTVDGKEYTWKAVVGDLNNDGDVLIGASLQASLENLRDAINGNPDVAGVTYADQTAAHDAVFAEDEITDDGGDKILTLSAIYPGVAGNALTLAETMANGAVGGATFSGGAGVAPTLQELRFTGEALVPGKETVSSDEIRADRSIVDLVQVGVNARGAVNVEVHHTGIDEFLLALLMSAAWSAETSGFVGTAVVDSAAQTITTNAGDWSATVQGARYIKLSGMTAAGNNGVKKIVSVVDDVLTLAPGSLVANENPVANLSISVRYARNGTFLRSFMLMKEYLSHTPRTAIASRGMCVNQFDLSLEPKQIAKAVFTFLGARQRESGGSFGAVNPTLPPTTPIMNTTSNVGSLGFGGTTFSADVMRIALSLNNNLAERPAIGVLTTLKPRKGTCVPTGTITAYFENRSLLRDFLAHASRSLEFPLIDSEGNVLNFYLPKLKFSAAQALIGGINTDIMCPLNFQAVKSGEEDTDFVIQIDSVTA